MDQKKLKMLKERAFQIRVNTINEIASFGSGHIGGAMSIADLLAYLYFDAMNIDPKDPKREDRDRLVLSKGHAGPALYAALALKGYFPLEMLSTLNQGGTRLPSHADMTKTPGIDFTAGSLGQGISAAVGIALGNRIKGINSYTYTIVGDGESQEGQVWEAAELAGAQSLDHLIVFEDLNRQQLDGYTRSIIPEETESVKKRWESFGFAATVINGHDIEAISNAVESAKKDTGRVHIIIMETEKGKGYIPAEGREANHSMPITKDDAAAAIEALRVREGM